MTTLQDVFNHIKTTDLEYKTRWVRPMGNAYAKAHENIKSYAAKQQKHDEMITELLLTVVSMGVGMGIAQMFAKTTLKSVAADVAVDFVANRNMVRTFDAMVLVAGSKPLSYFVSKSWDVVEKHMQARTKKALNSVFAPRPAILDALEAPLVFQNRMSSFVEEALLVASYLAEDVQASDLSEAEKNAVAATILDADVFRKAPKQKVIHDEEAAANTLELALYMVQVMNTDYFREMVTEPVGSRYRTHRNDVRAINVPTTHADYPDEYYKSERSVHRNANGRGSKTRTLYSRGAVFYEQPGSVFKKRINTLHNKVCGGDFFKGSSDGDELRRAEVLYGDLTNAYQVRF